MLTLIAGPVCLAGCRYVLAYVESFRGVKAGERVWQLGFGSGFKVNSAVWVAKKRIQVGKQHNAVLLTSGTATLAAVQTCGP